jgi:hypothetical protein
MPFRTTKGVVKHTSSSPNWTLYTPSSLQLTLFIAIRNLCRSTAEREKPFPIKYSAEIPGEALIC